MGRDHSTHKKYGDVRRIVRKIVCGMCLNMSENPLECRQYSLTNWIRAMRAESGKRGTGNSKGNEYGPFMLHGGKQGERDERR